MCVSSNAVGYPITNIGIRVPTPKPIHMDLGERGKGKRMISKGERRFFLFNKLFQA